MGFAEAFSELIKNFADPQFAVGQAFSILAMVFGFVSYQMKTPTRIIIFQLGTALSFAIHYFLINQIAGAVVNFISGIICIFFYLRSKKEKKSIAETIILCSVMVVCTVLTWGEWYTIFLLLGLIVINVSLAFTDPQKMRAALFIKSPLCLTYNLFALSIGGVIFECVALTSAVIGIIKNRKEKIGG